MKHMRTLVLIISFSALQFGCATPPELEVQFAQGSGEMEKATQIFKQHFPAYEDSDFGGLNSMCAALLSLHKYNEHEACVRAMGRKIGITDNPNKNEAMVYYQVLGYRAFDIGDEEAVLKYGNKADALDALLPLFVWEILGSTHARQGDYAKAREYIAKINSYKLKIFFGLVTLAETSISEMRRSSITRIYLNMGDSDKAVAEMAKPLADTSLSEYVLSGVMSVMESYSASLETSGEKWVRRGVESLPESGEELDTQDWGFGPRVVTGWMSARISMLNDSINEAEKVYLALIKEPKLAQMRSFQYDIVRDLSEINYLQGEYGESEKYLKDALAIIEHGANNLTSPREILHFIRKREDLYQIASNTYGKLNRREQFEKHCTTIINITKVTPSACKG